MKRLAWIFVAILLAAVASAQQYSMAPIAALDGNWRMMPLALADDGVIAGTTIGPVALSQLFVLDRGTLVILEPPSPYQYFGGMNVFHTLAGTALSTQGMSGYWYDGAIHPIGTLGGTSSYAAAVNDDSVIAGWAEAAGGARRAIVFANGVLKDLGWGNGSAAYAINDSRQVAGFVSVGGAATAVVSTDGVLATIPAAGFGIAIRKLSDNGSVGGTFYGLGGHQHGFVFDGNLVATMEALGTDSSIADVNSFGEAVGSYGSLGTGNRAFVYRNGVELPLEMLVQSLPPNIELNLATAINDLGQIIASGGDPSEMSDEPPFVHGHTWLLSPQFTPDEKLQRLGALVRMLPSRPGFATLAEVRLTAASRFLASGDLSGACSALHTFEDDLSRAVRTTKITAGVARRLSLVRTDAAQTIGCR